MISTEIPDVDVDRGLHDIVEKIWYMDLAVNFMKIDHAWTDEGLSMHGPQFLVPNTITGNDYRPFI